MNRRTRQALGVLNVVIVGVIIYVHALVGLGSEWVLVGAFHSFTAGVLFLSAVEIP